MYSLVVCFFIKLVRSLVIRGYPRERSLGVQQKGAEFMSGSIIYEVLLSVDLNMEDRLMAWLTPHVREMLTFDGFKSARIHRQLDVSGKQVDICVHYVLKELQHFQRYEVEHAARMRAQGIEAFPVGLSATRAVWQMCAELTAESLG